MRESDDLSLYAEIVFICQSVTNKWLSAHSFSSSAELAVLAV
jgi:hypothetical protein